MEIPINVPVSEDLIRCLLADIAYGKVHAYPMRRTLSEQGREIDIVGVNFTSRYSALKSWEDKVMGEGARKVEAIYTALADNVGIGLERQSVLLSARGCARTYSVVDLYQVPELRKLLIHEAERLTKLDGQSGEYQRFFDLVQHAYHSQKKVEAKQRRIV